MTGTVLEEGLRGAGGYLLERRQRALHARTTIRSGERATRDIVSRAIYAEMRAGRDDAQRRRLHLAWATSARTTVREGIQGHGRALRRLRLRPRRRPGRSRADRALHDGRRRIRGRLHDGAAGPLRRGRGLGRRARREPPGRQRRGELDRVRRHRRATPWRAGSNAKARSREPDAAALERRVARARAPLGRPAGDLERDPRSDCTT